MRSGNVRSVSFTFHKNPSDGVNQKPSGCGDRSADEAGKSDSSSTRARRVLQPASRQRLQDRFDMECPYALSHSSRKTGNGSRSSLKKWTEFNLSLPSVQPRKMLRSGADKISKTISNVRQSLDVLSQRFRASTRRRQRFENESPLALTPQTRSRYMLGRTPTKLYSPFGIETPSFHDPCHSKENHPTSGGKVTPRRSARLRSSPYSTVWSKEKDTSITSRHLQEHEW